MEKVYSRHWRAQKFSGGGRRMAPSPPLTHTHTHTHTLFFREAKQHFRIKLSSLVILPKEGLLLLTPPHLYSVHIPVVIREVKGFMLILDKILYSTGTGRVGEIYQFIPVVFPLPPFTSYSPIQI